MTTMKKVSDLHIRVCDKGLFLTVARRLARDAARVTYWTPAEKAFPKVWDCAGDGFRDIERVDCYLDDLGSVDCFVFPDIGFSGMQAMVESLGIPTWGARGGSMLEESRGLFLDVLEKTGLPVPAYEKIEGITNLRRHLADQDDRWIKVSKFRGDWETVHWRGPEDMGILDARAARLGPFGEQMVFYVFEPIDAEIEDGCDTWCVDGRYPSLVLHGMEAKDKAYLGTFQPYADLPGPVRAVNDQFGPVLAEYGYRSCFSTEVRITEDGTGYFIDPTCRFGSPPSQVMTELIGNFSEVIWAGANGECLDPEPTAKFRVQAIIDMRKAHGEWTRLQVDKELDPWVKCGNCVRDGDSLYFPPDPDLPPDDVRWLVGIGDTIADAIAHLQENAKLLPDRASCETHALADLLREIEKAESQGMEFTDQAVPEPEIVLAKS